MHTSKCAHPHELGSGVPCDRDRREHANDTFADEPPLIVHWAGGNQLAIACRLLQKHGQERDLVGFAAWKASDLRLHETDNQ